MKIQFFTKICFYFTKKKIIFNFILQKYDFCNLIQSKLTKLYFKKELHVATFNYKSYFSNIFQDSKIVKKIIIISVKTIINIQIQVKIVKYNRTLKKICSNPYKIGVECEHGNRKMKLDNKKERNKNINRR